MKKNVLWVILDLIFIVIFNTVFFIVGGFHHPASVWISYCFIHFAYLMVIITPFLLRKSSSAAVFGFSLYSISSSYFIIEFVVGLIFVLIRGESFKSALVVQMIIAGLYGILLVSHLIANESTADNIVRHEREVAYIKDATSKVKSLLGRVKDRKANREMEKLYDLLHSSPTKSTLEMQSIEFNILQEIGELEEVVQTDNVNNIISQTKAIISMVEERNRKLRLSN